MTQKNTGLAAANSKGPRKVVPLRLPNNRRKPPLQAAPTGYRIYLIAQLRIAGLRARLWHSEIAAMTSALRADLIDPDEAIAHLHECGAIKLVATSS